MPEHLRLVARHIFAEALAACGVSAAVERMLHAERGWLHIAERSYCLADFTDVRVVAIGKAGAALFDSVRPLLAGALPVTAVISAPARPVQLGQCDRYFAGGHPLPNADSLAAAQASMELLAGATAQTLVLFLLSGGASAMFEAPLQRGVTLADLVELNQRLVGCGATIAEINCVRKHLSAVKGGRLLLLAGEAMCVSLLVSDVPPGQIDALGSGPTLPDSTTVAECQHVVETYLGGASALPTSFARQLSREVAETPKGDDSRFSRMQQVVLLDNLHLLQAAEAAAQERGFRVVIDNRCDDWEYRDAGDYLVARQRELVAEQGGPVCLLSGGEVTVRLPEHVGAGGRNQQWALHSSRLLRESGTAATLLSAGSDGVDGASPAAGCVADETTWQRARSAGFNPERHLLEFDTYPLFLKLGDAIQTGPTGTNLRDLRILLSSAAN